MSQRRFTLVVAALAALMAVGSFAIAYQTFDDGGTAPDPPAPATDATTPTVTEPPIAATTTTAAGLLTEPGELDTPTWVVVVASGTSRPDADAAARRVASSGYPAGVLRSDDYPSLSKGLWVAYVGPYPDAATAQSTVDRLSADGFDGSYPRCVGDRKDCRPTSSDD